MWIKQIFLCFLGLAYGGVISGAVFAFVVSIGVIQRLVQKTKTAGNVLLYEDAILLGGVIGTIISIFQVPLHQYLFGVGWILLLLFGLFSGIYVGCLAISLVEVINTIPIITRRIKMKHGIRWMLLGIALGKMIGSLIYFYKGW
ncbi:stage V sporulation protein AB [Anaerosacchariphilus polymeriproducens]|uniref:Stage V sporulation protein AB n=1 Tax=Anaerosacchariphilus polymeriproducens TaxID=1812858 RepID=A0A371AUX6_9FIRM|nr:stage V sporulation protein AB [Anaerosacchariphilus polymeriproducens]RDU23378.1 stage V sporulation protein AB [Anaerosacchariphilus polymeriproducens]